MCVSVGAWLCMYICINSYCLLGDYAYGGIDTVLTVLFVEMYINVVLVKLFVS